MEFDTLVREARSCRRFHESSRLSSAVLTGLVDCARIAPCGANRQSLRYIVTVDAERNARLCAALKWAAYLTDWKGPEEGERPAGYIIILSDPEESKNPSVDLGIAAQTIMLGASAQGLGCCMLGAFDRKAVAAMLDVPPHYEVLLVLALGVPAERRVLDPVAGDGSIRYWRDAEGVHHVPKRSLETVLVATFGDDNE